MSVDCKILFSLSVHEEIKVVLNQIDNIRHFVPNSIIVIHVNSTNNELFEQLHAAAFLLQNVYLTTDRVDSTKGAFVLDIAHLNNFKYAKKLGLQFEYIILEASNSLFVRYGLPEYIANFDAGSHLRPLKIDSHGDWNKKVFSHLSFSNIRQEFIEIGLDFDTIYKSTHEGSFYRKDIADFIFNFVSNIRDKCIENNELPNYPTEEFWFPFALKCYQLKHPNIEISPTITYMPWNRRLSWNKNDVRDFLFREHNLKNFYSIKRIERNSEDEVRNFIQEIFGY